MFGCEDSGEPRDHRSEDALRRRGLEMKTVTCSGTSQSLEFVFQFLLSFFLRAVLSVPHPGKEAGLEQLWHLIKQKLGWISP